MKPRGLTKVDIVIQNNVYWDDAFQYGMPEDQTWNFNGMSFLLDIKQHEDAVNPLLSLNSTGGTIVVADPINRILNMYVTDLTIRAALPLGQYVYDLIMVNNSTGERDALMYGELFVVQGVTLEG